MAYDQTIYRIMPYPLIGEEDDVGGEYELTGEVEVRLVVAYDHRRLGNCNATL